MNHNIYAISSEGQGGFVTLIHGLRPDVSNKATDAFEVPLYVAATLCPQVNCIQ